MGEPKVVDATLLELTGTLAKVDQKVHFPSLSVQHGPLTGLSL
jgi:hypothetical protein